MRQSATSRAEEPVTSVITTRWLSWSRTTIRPSVLAMSGSSTPASCVFVPVSPLATPSLLESALLGSAYSMAPGALAVAPSSSIVDLQRVPAQP